MVWNILAECIAAVFVVIIFVYSRKGSVLPSFKNKVFQCCLLVTFFSIAFNILSTMLIYQHTSVPVPIVWIITTIYFICTPLLGALYFIYIIAVIYEDFRSVRTALMIGLIPYGIYFVLLMLNGFTRNIFYLDPVNGYTRGSLIASTYIVFYLYIAFSLLIILFKGALVEPSTRRILASFPLIATLVIAVQQMFPDQILSGSAAASSLLIIYLYFQNKRMAIDYLTGISNRQEFLKMLDLKITRRSSGHLDILVISLNGFKFINDKFGQQNGDLLLQQICGYLKTLVNLESLYRYSGDQFAIVLENKGDEQIQTLLDQIGRRMHNPWKIDSLSYVVSSSVGIVRYPDHADVLDEIINGIEYAVAQAKADKLHHYCYCSPEMLNKIRRKHQILDILEDRLKNDSIEMYYQPIYFVSTGTFRIAESLMRLNDTPLGTIPPSEFIPIAEESGLIVKMTYQILDKVCKYIKFQLDHGVDFEGVSVNFSVIQFMQDDLAPKVLQIIEENGIPCSKIKIEVTESVLASNLDKVIEFIKVMNSRGVRFGLDDFGTGYSNLSTVLEIPFDTVKLDKSLIWLAVRDFRSAILVRQISAAMKQLSIRVLAEGIENEEQLQFALDCGCDMIQGYYYAKPLPGPEAEQYFTKKPSSSCLTHTA